MALPTEPGVYEDVRGDLWLLEDDGDWRHAARRLNDDSLSPVLGRFSGPISPEALEHGNWDPGTDVLPLKRIAIEDVPPDIL